MTLPPEEFVLRAADGTELQHCYWPAPQPRAALLLLHGVASHLLWYAPLAETLADGGVSVLIADRRGCGRSGGRRGDAPSAATLLSDVRLAAAALRERAPEVPQHIAGVSLGALLAIATAAASPAAWTSLILMTPALKLATPLTRWQRAQLAVANVLWPAAPLRLPYGAESLARTSDWCAALEADSLRIDSITARFGKLTMALQQRAFDAAPVLELPLLAQLAGADRVVDNAAAQDFVAATNACRRRTEIFAGAPHGLPLALARGRLEALLLDWMLHGCQQRDAQPQHAEFARDDTGLLRRPGR